MKTIPYTYLEIQKVKIVVFWKTECAYFEDGKFRST